MPKQVSFDWTLPEAVFGEDLKEEELRQRVQEGVALSLFREGRVSSGLAAEMLGITRRKFMELLYEKGLPYFDLTEKALEREFASVEELRQTLAKEKAPDML